MNAFCECLTILFYSRHSQTLRYFRLTGGMYEEYPLQVGNCAIWLADLEVGLGIWQGEFEGIPGNWLRWCNQDGTWLLTDTDQERQAKEQERQAKEQERQAKEQERQAKEQAQGQLLQAAKKLLAIGISLDQVIELLALSNEQLEQLRKL